MQQKNKKGVIKVGDRVSKEEIQKASDVHILDYLNSKGENLIKQGKYYRHAEHDSLIVNENGKWYWNSRSEGGFGAISFARTFYDMSFQDAVRDVNGLSITRDYTRDIKNEVPKEFNYPKQYEATTQKNVRQYLINERMIDEKLVESLIKNDFVAEDKLKNCVFKWKDSQGKVVGADRQGTVKMDTKRGYFKSIAANSKEDGGFRLDVGVPNKIALFESPIDAVSYYELHRPENIRLQSMSGLKDQSATTAIKDLFKECRLRDQKLEKVIIGVDNDEAGKIFTERWENLINIAERHEPIMKDWNLDLKKHKKEKELKKQQSHELELER